MSPVGSYRTDHLSYCLVKDNSSLDGTLVLDGFQRLTVLLQLKCLVDDTLGLDLARVKVVNRGRYYDQHSNCFPPRSMKGEVSSRNM